MRRHSLNEQLAECFEEVALPGRKGLVDDTLVRCVARKRRSPPSVIETFRRRSMLSLRTSMSLRSSNGKLQKTNFTRAFLLMYVEYRPRKNGTETGLTVGSHVLVNVFAG